MASPSLLQPAPSLAVTLAARTSLGKPPPGQSSLTPGTLTDRANKLSWSSAILEAHSALTKKDLETHEAGCLVFPREGWLPRMCALGFQVWAPCASWRSWLKGASAKTGL